MADRHREARQAVWRKLKNCRGNQAQALMKSVVTSAMYLHDVEIVEKTHHWEMTLLGKRAILLVIFDDRSSLGLVRLRVKRGSQEMDHIFEDMQTKKEKGASSPTNASPFSEITDEDIDALFSE